MLKFTYSAKDKSGKTIKGEIESDSKDQALGMLREKGLLILRLEEAKSKFFSTSSTTSKKKIKVPMEELVLFTRQMATLTAAGITIVPKF